MPRTSLRFDSISFATHVDTLLKNLNIAPKNIDIFHLAFVHRSVLNEAKSGYTQSNERLEYLGDAVLEMVITERIYHDYPAHNE
jgi:ribonuclease-3